MELFKKEYDGGSLIDIPRDVSEALDIDFNSLAALITQDQYGFFTGTLTVTIVWEKG